MPLNVDASYPGVSGRTSNFDRTRASLKVGAGEWCAGTAMYRCCCRIRCLRRSGVKAGLHEGRAKQSSPILVSPHVMGDRDRASTLVPCSPALLHLIPSLSTFKTSIDALRCITEADAAAVRESDPDGARASNFNPALVGYHGSLGLHIRSSWLVHCLQYSTPSPDLWAWLALPETQARA